MSDSDISLDTEHITLLPPDNYTSNCNSYLLERLKYQNLLKDQAILKASKLINELKQQVQLLRQANHTLATLNSNKTTEIKELQRMLKSTYHESPNEKVIEQMMHKLHEKDLKIRKLQILIRDQERSGMRVKTYINLSQEADRYCKTEGELDSPLTKDKNKDNGTAEKGYESAEKREKCYSSIGVRHSKNPKNSSSNTKKKSQIRLGSEIKTKYPEPCKTQDLQFEITKLKHQIQQKDDQILSMMKRNKVINDKLSSQPHPTPPTQNRYKNPRQYYLQKVHSGATTSSVFLC